MFQQGLGVLAMEAAGHKTEGLSDGESAATVDECLERFLAERSLPVGLAAAIRYVLAGGGKRLRPLLAIRCCQAVGGSADLALPAVSVRLTPLTANLDVGPAPALAPAPFEFSLPALSLPNLQ